MLLNGRGSEDPPALHFEGGPESPPCISSTLPLGGGSKDPPRLSEAHAPMMNQGQVVEEKNFVPEKNSEEIPLCLFGLAGEVPEGISNFSGLKEVPEGISNFFGMREMPEGISTVMKEIPEGIPSMSHVAALDPPGHEGLACTFFLSFVRKQNM